MSGPDHDPGFEPGDHPELTDDQLASLRPLEQVLPALAAATRRSRGPQRAPTKELVSLRVDQRVLEHYRSTGRGWQSRMNDALLKAAGLE